MARTSKSRGTPMFKMRSGNRSTFKMMGSSSPVRDHETDASGKTIEHPEGKWIKKWNPETQQIDIVKAGGVTTTTTTTGRTGTASREKPHVSGFREACKGKTSGTGVDSTGRKWNCGDRDPDWKPSSEIETKPLSEEDVKVDVEKDPEKKKCDCLAYDYKKASGKMIEYPCDEPKPKACVEGSKTHTKRCQEKPGYARRKARCVEGTKKYKAGTWDDNFCTCDHKKKLISKIKDIKIPKINWPKGKKNCRKTKKGTFCEDAYTGIVSEFSPK